MDAIMNQPTVLNGTNALIFGKDLSGQTLSGTYTLIACVGSVTVTSGKFYLYNCSGLVVTNQNNAATVIRDGYAIGDYYFSATENPASKFGGYWEDVPNGTFLMAAGAGGIADQTGGEATHTLTIEEMPRHFHLFPTVAGQIYDESGSVLRGSMESSSFIEKPTSEVGGNVAHNNLPPYRTAHIYKRIANPGNSNMQ